MTGPQQSKVAANAEESPSAQSTFDRWFAEQVARGLEDAERGRLIPHAVVVQNCRRQRARLLAAAAARRCAALRNSPATGHR